MRVFVYAPLYMFVHYMFRACERERQREDVRKRKRERGGGVGVVGEEDREFREYGHHGNQVIAPSPHQPGHSNQD